jgi:hypothetical protein
MKDDYSTVSAGEQSDGIGRDHPATDGASVPTDEATEPGGMHRGTKGG